MPWARFHSMLVVGLRLEPDVLSLPTTYFFFSDWNAPQSLLPNQSLLFCLDPAEELIVFQLFNLKRNFLDAICSQAGESWPGQDKGRLGTGQQGDRSQEEGWWTTAEVLPGQIRKMHLVSYFLVRMELGSPCYSSAMPDSSCLRAFALAILSIWTSPDIKWTFSFTSFKSLSQDHHVSGDLPWSLYLKL